MDNEHKLQQAFVAGLGIAPDSDFASLRYRGVEQWDSVAHMQLISEIEDAFDIMIDTDDVIDLSSWDKAREILGKYDVAL